MSTVLRRDGQSGARSDRLDLIRGIIMVLMTVDHARDYGGAPGLPGDPMDLTQVGPWLFLVRWMTHLCAPAFALLMGASAWLSGQKRTAAELSRYLAMRGAILILLEFTLVDWGWTWNPLWPRKFFQVIGALGCSMIILSVITRLGRVPALLAGATITLLHNLSDGIRFPDEAALHYVWSFVHQRNVLPLGGGLEVRTSYPFLPILGVALLGYGMGPWIAEGNRKLRQAGIALVAAFFVFRLGLGYGDPNPFRLAPDKLTTVMAVFNVTKYPLSLQFVCITLGPALLALGQREAWFRKPEWLLTLGRTPMFFYILHLWALHALALICAVVAGYPVSAIDLAQQFGGRPAGFVFPLWFTFPLAAVGVGAVFPACRWYEEQKRKRRWAWTGFI